MVVKRFWELDFLRGLAIMMMILYHALYDFNFFGVYSINVDHRFWNVFGDVIPVIFLFLVGVCLTISYSRSESGFKKYLFRGLKIFSWGLIVTVVTYLFLGNGFVVFGILHMIGVSVIIAYPFLRFRYLNLFLGVIVVGLGLYLFSIEFGFFWLMWLGFVPSTMYTVDYFPLLPWFGVVLFGIGFGNWVYPQKSGTGSSTEQRFSGILKIRQTPNFYDVGRSVGKSRFAEFGLVRFFGYLGRNSLFIYLVHQPLLVGVIYFLI